MSKLLCSDPKFILHPLAAERVTRYGTVVVHGQKVPVKRSLRNLYVFDDLVLKSYIPSLTEENIDRCYILDETSGESFPLYLQVRCGKCDNCRASKLNAFVQRCEMESQLYDCKPFFITLTYDEEHKPKTGVDIRDVQLFFKRFRINLERHGYRQRIRYVLCAEYGRNTYRPHYHALIWNLRQTDMVEYREIGKILERSWRNGFVMSRLVDASDNKTFYYTAKYLRKDCIVPDGCCSPFICSSNRGGGIGAALLRSISGEILRTLDKSPKFLNKFSGQAKDLILSKYVLDKVMPSISLSIPSTVKNSLRTLNLCYAQMQYENDPNINLFTDDYEKFNSFFGKYLYAPKLSYKEVSTGFSSQWRTSGALLRDTLESVRTLDRWYKRGSQYFDDALRMNDQRAVYLYKLFELTDEVTVDYISHRGYLFRRSSALARQRELL